MVTVDEIRNILIAHSHEHYRQIQFAKIPKGCEDQISDLAEEFFDRLNSRINLTAEKLKYNLVPLDDE